MCAAAWRSMPSTSRDAQAGVDDVRQPGAARLGRAVGQREEVGHGAAAGYRPRQPATDRPRDDARDWVAPSRCARRSTATAERIVELPATAAAAGIARRELAATPGLAGELGYRVLLLASELIAVFVADVEPRPGGVLRLSIAVTPERVRITVAGDGAARQRRCAAALARDAVARRLRPADRRPHGRRLGHRRRRTTSRSGSSCAIAGADGMAAALFGEFGVAGAPKVPSARSRAQPMALSVATSSSPVEVGDE